jgi:hypothetical protein
MQAGALFRRWIGDETNLRVDETKFRTRENRLKRTLGITWLTNDGAAKAHDRGQS